LLDKKVLNLHLKNGQIFEKIVVLQEKHHVLIDRIKTAAQRLGIYYP
jgi:hypothetical protein